MLIISKPPFQIETGFSQQLRSVNVFYYPRYENIIIMGEFIMTVENHHRDLFIQTYALSCLITKHLAINPKLQHVLTLL